MKKLLFIAIPLLMTSVPAAAEVPAGFRLEALVGYDRLKGDFIPNVTGNNATFGKESRGGFFYGGAVGFDFPMGAALAFGADAEVTLATTDLRTSAVNTVRDELSVRHDLYVGGRVTGMISESVNAYVKGGYTTLKLRFKDDATATAAPALAGTLNGLRAAVGVQISGEGRDYYGFEARYSDYEAGVSRQQAMAFVGYRF